MKCTAQCENDAFYFLSIVGRQSLVSAFLNGCLGDLFVQHSVRMSAGDYREEKSDG